MHQSTVNLPQVPEYPEVKIDTGNDSEQWSNSLGAKAKDDSQSFVSVRTATSIGESIYASTILALEDDRRRSQQINDQQWVLQRKKIGLPRKSVRTSEALLETERNKMSTIMFIESHFNRKECHRYVQGNNKINPSQCFCGGEISSHGPEVRNKFAGLRSRAPREADIQEESEDEDSNSIDGNHTDTSSITELLTKAENKSGRTRKIKFVDERRGVGGENEVKATDKTVEIRSTAGSRWDANTALKELSTNAYGYITFEGRNTKPASYIRIADNSTMKSVIDLMVHHWDILTPRPHLVLSIVGGAKNFQMDGRKKEAFKTGLISAARSTHAWIMSGGTNTGSMKLVGEAVTEGQFLVNQGSELTLGLKALGVCSWGYIHANETLINQSSSEFNQVHYNANVKIKRHVNPPLSPDHTHFLLVDDGYRNSYIGSGGIGSFISRLEKRLMEPPPTGLGIPVITLLLEGGSDAINEVRDNLNEGQPCVIIEGSGRAADILGYAYRNAVKNKTTGSYSIPTNHQKKVEALVMEHYSDRLMGPDGEQKKTKILSWIEECIRFGDLITIYDIRTEKDLDKKILSALLKGDLNIKQQMYLAMIWDRVDIAEERFFLNQKVSWDESEVDDIMTQALLMQRTNFIEVLTLNGFSFSRYLTVERLRLLYNEGASQHRHLTEQIESLVGPCPYIHLRHIHKLLKYVMKSHRLSQYQNDRPNYNGVDTVDKNNLARFENPFMELYIWSVLCFKEKLLDFFWTKSDQPLVTVIVGASIYSALIKLYTNQQLKVKKVNNLMDKYIGVANKLTKIAYEKDREKAIDLVYVRFNRFGERSLINLGYIGNLRAFIANEVCQEYVNQSWRRGISKLSVRTAFTAIFIPPLVFTSLVKFLKLGDDGGELTLAQKLFVFYRAPLVKYIEHCISYSCFLLLYTYVAMFDFEWEYQKTEIVLYVWFLILILDELREFLIQPSSSPARKLRDYSTSVWNKFDVLIYTVAVFSLILKNFSNTFQVARALFAFNAAFLYTRLFRVYHANWSLGPKLVIFHRMLPELMIFMVLLLIFILGYGTASQALINPGKEFELSNLSELLNGILYLPYWQMYGELNLDKITVTNRSVCHTESFCEDMHFYNYVTPVLLAVYLIVANVMLLNLLIAIFTSVFEEVQENSKEVWKWEMYRLVEEFDQKPGLTPPLVILEDLWKLGKGIWKKTCRKKRENLDEYMKSTLEALQLFEKDCLNEYLNEQDNDDRFKLENQILGLEERLQRLSERIEVVGMTEDISIRGKENHQTDGGKNSARFSEVLDRMDSLEETMAQIHSTSARYLEGINRLEALIIDSGISGIKNKKN